MKILLDGNFPLPLYHRLRASGYDAEHIIVLGLRGVKDSEIRKRLAREGIVFFTQDTEFEDLAENCLGQVVVSRIRQNLPIQRRVEIWWTALQEFLARQRQEKVFELFENGHIVPWKV